MKLQCIFKFEDTYTEISLVILIVIKNLKLKLTKIQKTP